MQEQFRLFRFVNLEAGKPEALRACRTRIVIIEVNGERRLVKGRLTTCMKPQSAVSGIYLQANYIEALLDDRYMRQVPACVGPAF